jgi:hypothetical protein
MKETQEKPPYQGGSRELKRNEVESVLTKNAGGIPTFAVSLSLSLFSYEY